MLWWWLLVAYGVGAIAYAVLAAALVRVWASRGMIRADEPRVPAAVRAYIVLSSAIWPVLFVRDLCFIGRGLARGR